MNWEQVEEKMTERDFKLNLVARQPGTKVPSENPIAKQVYIREVDGIRLECHVTTELDQCEKCWKARIVYYGLKYFMAIDSQQFTFVNDDLFIRVEAQVVEYALICNKANNGQ